MKNILTIALLLLVTSEGFSKRFFTIVVASNATCNQRPLKPLDVIGAKDVVQIAANGYLALIDNATNLYEFRQGAVKMDTVFGHGESNSSHLGIPIELLYKEKENDRVIKREGSLKVFTYYPFADHLTYAPNEKITFNWIDLGSEKAPGYKFLAIDPFTEKSIYEKMIRGETFTLPLTELSGYKEFFCYLIREDRPNVKSNVTTVNIIKSKNKNSFETKDHSALLYTMVALILEDHNEFEHAKHFYEKAFLQEPGVSEYKMIYDRFMARRKWL